MTRFQTINLITGQDNTFTVEIYNEINNVDTPLTVGSATVRACVVDYRQTRQLVPTVSLTQDATDTQFWTGTFSQADTDAGLLLPGGKRQELKQEILANRNKVWLQVFVDGTGFDEPYMLESTVTRGFI